MAVDSIAALTKLASIRAAGLCYDEIAVNTSMLQEVPSKRKIPAVLKVMAGSLSIKMAVIPAALLVTAFAPGVTPVLLMFGGFHLASEGLKSLLGKEHDKNNDGKNDATGKKVPKQSGKEFEKNTIKKVLVIDGLLSVEIAVMTLPIIAGATPLIAAAALAATGLIRVAWMYGLIGGIINMPRAGEWLSKRKGDSPVAKVARGIGKVMNEVNPYLIKSFRIAGTVALLGIGGSLILHGFPSAAHLVEHALGAVTSNSIVSGLLGHMADGLIGMGTGFVAAPILERLYSGIGKAIKAILVKPLKHVLGKKKKGAEPKLAPVNNNADPAVAQNAKFSSQSSALSNVPDVKHEMNAAAEKNEVPMLPKTDNVAPKPPKINPPVAA